VTRRWSLDRLATGGALAAWAALFWTLLVTGRTSLYLSSRTAWLIPVGAVLTTAAAAGRLATGRTYLPTSQKPPWGAGLLILPVVLALVAPPATLSSYAVGRRSSFGGAGIAATARAVAGPLDFVDVAAARSTRDALATLRRRSGERIFLEGFVTTQSNLGADELLLTRFIVTCCVADATSAQVRVVGVPPGSYVTDDWVRVTGRVYALGAEVVVVAEEVEAIPVPTSPYLTP
jgi:putative membrane protein